MTGIPTIKVTSVKGAIPIQSQLSHHLKLTLLLFTRACHGTLIECIQQSLYKGHWSLRPG